MKLRQEQLTERQRLAWGWAMDSEKNLFVSGFAGTGKTGKPKYESATAPSENQGQDWIGSIRHEKGISGGEISQIPSPPDVPHSRSNDDRSDSGGAE